MYESNADKIFEQSKAEQIQRQQADANTITNLMDRNVSHDRYLEFTKQSDEFSADAQFMQEQPMQEVDPDKVNMEKLNQMSTEILENPNAQYGGVADQRASFSEVRKTYHDYAHLDSAEQGIADWVNAKKAAWRNPETVDPAAALEEARKQGVELKFDKPITRGELQYAIDKALHKKDLEQRLALYHETGDYTKLQELLLLGSTISGGVGAAETGLMIATSVLGGQGAAWGTARLASILGKGSSVARGVQLAQRMAMAERLAQTYANTNSEIKAAANIATRIGTELKAADLATKASYDTYRAGKLIQGTHASLGTVSGYFAVDSLVTDLPVEISKYLGSQVSHDGEYGSKQVLAGLMLATSIGAGAPVAGNLAKGVPGTLAKINEIAQNVINERTAKQFQEALVKGYEPLAKEAEAKGIHLSEATENVFNIAKKNGVASQEFQEAVVQVANANLSDEEVSLLMTTLVKAIKNGESLNILDKLPFRNQYYSNVLGMLDTMETSVKNGTGAVEFFDLLKERKVPLSFMDNVIPEDFHPLKEAMTRITSNFIGTGVKIGTEGGALGRTFAHGLTTEDAKNFLFNVYRARMCDNYEEGIEAGLKAEEYIAKLAQIKKQVDEIVGTYEHIRNTNEAARRVGESIVYKYSGGGQDIYKLSDGTSGSLQSALDDLAILMLPESKAAEYQAAREAMGKEAQAELLQGHGTLSQAERDLHTKTLEEVEKYKQEVVDHWASWSQSKSKSGDTFDYFNLNATVEGSKEQTAALKKMSEELDNMIQENTDLLNTDRIFQQNYANPEELLEKIQGKQEIPELGFSYDRNTTSALDMQKILSSEDASMGRLATAKANFMRWENTETQSSINKMLDYMSKSKDEQYRLSKGYYYDLTNGVQVCEQLLTQNFGDFRNQFMEALQANKFFQMMGERGMSDMTQATLARVIKEQGQIFADTLSETLLNSIPEKMADGIAKSKFKEAIDLSVDAFVEFLNKDPEKGLGTLVTKHAANVETSTAEEVTEELMKLDAQKQLFDNILEPMLKEVGKQTADLQAQLFHSLNRTNEVWEKCLKNPGKMSELILGEVTMTYMPTFGASESIENLSGFAVEYGRFLKALDTLDDAGAGVQSLREWAFDPKNMPEIRNAIVDRWAMLNGKMTEAERLQFKTNSREARVAMAYLDNLAEMQAKMYNLGSGKQDLASFFDNGKLKRAYEFLGTDKLKGKLAGALQDAANEPFVQKYLPGFFPTSNSKEAVGKANLALHWLEQLDLDKHFGRTKISLNELRDAMLEGFIPGQGSGLQRMVQKYSKAEVETALKKIHEGFFGVPKQSLGLIDRIHSGSNGASAELTSHASKYLEDMKPKLHYKTLAAQKEDMQYFGYDNMKAWYENNVGGAKNAYAVLAKAGVEPFQFFNNLKDMARTYANHFAPLEHGVENAKLLQESVNSPTWESRLNFAVNDVCGTYKQAAASGARWVKALTRFLSAPMLMKAGVKSLTDYNYQFQYLVSMGLASGGDIGARARVYGKFFRAITGDKKLAQMVYVSQGLKTDTVQNMMYNTLAPVKAKGLNKYASALSKTEAAAQGFSDFMLNKLAWIGPLTDYNRSNAALSLMSAIGDYAPTRFAQMPERLQHSLGRYGITEWEWDNIFSKDAIMNTNKYIERFKSGVESNPVHDYNMFFPDLLADLPDEKVAKYLTDQGLEASPIAIERYRNNLVDRAAMLVNASADEMTSIPTARIQGALHLGNDPNTWAGVFMGNVMQFQSFGAAVNFYQWGRRMATHMDINDPLFSKLFMSMSGFGSTAIDMAGFVTELAIGQYLINEATSSVAGNYKGLHDDKGEFKGENLAEKVTKAYFDQTGILSPLLDAILTGVTQPRGSGGGIALSVLPAASNVISKASRITNAATRKSTEGNRAQAIGGALAQDAADFIGIPNQPFFQAAWGWLIGDKFIEWQMGTNYDKWVRQRMRNGYGPNWLQTITGKQNIWE